MTVYKGWNAGIYKDGVKLGFADSASVEIAANLDAWYELGTRNAVQLAEGNEEISGSFSKAWVDKNYLGLVSSTGALTEFTLCFTLGVSGPAVYVYCYNCKFDKGSLDIPQDGFLKESYDFKATSITLV